MLGGKGPVWKRFEPDSRRELYAIEFQIRKLHCGKSWVIIYAYRLKVFQDFEDKAKEQL